MPTPPASPTRMFPSLFQNKKARHDGAERITNSHLERDGSGLPFALASAGLLPGVIAAGLFGLIPGPLQAQTSWNVAVSGDWSTGSNWDPVTAGGPSGVGAIVNFDFNITGNRTVTLDLNRTAGVLNIGHPTRTYSIAASGGSQLTLDNGAAPAEINFLAGSTNGNTISAPLILAGDLRVTNASGELQNFSGDIDSITPGAKTIVLTAESSDVVRFNATALTNTVTDGVINLQIEAGTMRFTNDDRRDALTTASTITINGGTLQATSGGTAGTLGNATLVFNGGNLSKFGGGNLNLFNDYSFDADATVSAGASGRMEFRDTGDLGGGIRTLNIVGEVRTRVLNNGGAGSGGGIIKTGSGTLVFDSGGANRFDGGVVINEGTVWFRSGNAFHVDYRDEADITINNGAEMDIGGGSQGLGVITLNDGIITGSGTITGLGYEVQSGTISPVLVGAGATLTKAGAGTVVLEGDNTYTGTTTINGGTLIVNGNASNATGAVTVNSGGTLGGNGTIGGELTVLSGGAISPGASIGTLTTSNVALEGGSVFVFEFSTNGSNGTAGTEWDWLNIEGTLDLTGASAGDPIVIKLVTMEDQNTPGLLQNWNPEAASDWLGFITTTGGVTGFNPDLFVFDTSDFQNVLDDDGFFSVVLNNGGLDLAYIPEPTSTLLMLMAVAGGLARRRRRPRLV